MNPTEKPANIAQLFQQFIQQRAAAWRSGTAAETVEPSSEVTPFQAAAVSLIDPRSALQEAGDAAVLLLGKDEAKAFRDLKMPPEWTMLVRNVESMVAVPFCVGNFPQLMREVTPLLAGEPLAEMIQPAGRQINLTELPEWGRRMVADSRFAEALFALGALRIARQFDEARELLKLVRENAPASWNDLLRNEEAALAWHQGDTEAAAKIWEQLSESDNPVVLFNRGLAALFSGKPGVASPLFTRAADELPEDSGWHHLARLYLALAESA
jgi:tetratricopeptide (TPR) repeat protein